ncbi:hypothetical protein [Pantoea ananatis]
MKDAVTSSIFFASLKHRIDDNASWRSIDEGEINKCNY